MYILVLLLRETMSRSTSAGYFQSAVEVHGKKVRALFVYFATSKIKDL